MPFSRIVRNQRKSQCNNWEKSCPSLLHSVSTACACSITRFQFTGLPICSQKHTRNLLHSVLWGFNCVTFGARMFVQFVIATSLMCIVAEKMDDGKLLRSHKL